MRFQEFGMILFVERYQSCVEFYEDILQLSKRSEKDSLTCFNLPHGYLMVEQGGKAANGEKGRHQNPSIIRFDVENLPSEVDAIEERGGHFIHRSLSFEWGTIAVLLDPDGNRIELGEVNDLSASN